MAKGFGKFVLFVAAVGAAAAGAYYYLNQQDSLYPEYDDDDFDDFDDFDDGEGETTNGRNYVDIEHGTSSETDASGEETTGEQ
ncbi:MAG: hypothetical protein IJR58_01215 [Lachnospiraceae bacterium]|nr:hypothetical protein [Lachnospiraceae bacterium]